jgi:hypothetical protein
MKSTEEFTEGKENYCPRCYFEDDKKVLRKECPCKKSGVDMLLETLERLTMTGGVTTKICQKALDDFYNQSTK